jgi:hypothetical protein
VYVQQQAKGALMRAVLIVIAALVFAAPAAAGGWATAGLGPPDDGIGPGDTWNAEVTILQHGNPLTPLVGITPEVIITNAKGVRKEFAAAPTGKDGVYVAKVKFPSAGEWRYSVYDGFTQYGGARTHQFAPVQIGPAADGGFSPPLWPLAVAAALMAIAAALLFARRLRPVASPAAQQ